MFTIIGIAICPFIQLCGFLFVGLAVCVCVCPCVVKCYLCQYWWLQRSQGSGLGSSGGLSCGDSVVVLLDCHCVQESTFEDPHCSLLKVILRWGTVWECMYVCVCLCLCVLGL